MLHRGRLASHFQDVQLLLSHSLYHLIGTAAGEKTRDRAGRAWSRLDPPSRALTRPDSLQKSRPACNTHNALRGQNASGRPRRQRCVCNTHHVTGHTSLLSLISGDLPSFNHLPATTDLNSFNVGRLQPILWFGTAAPAWDAISLLYMPFRLTCRTNG